MKQDLVSDIKRIVEQVSGSAIPLKINFSEYLAKQLNYNYTYLSNQFFKTEGKTLVRYFMEQRIEKVKYLLDAGRIPTEIAFILHYSSLPHLANQFKKITGITMTEYKQLTPATA
jgi:AraC-like DNA-binding protein